ncbi:hypothetical protein FJQ89_06555 [Janthinobacterium tructae]|uniref:BD-FAE-like domain-containing protein n=2 Tax=Janthinobacterium tructae TaxID=2590869 RepID=A0A4Y6RAT2_9BURK|nr:hypothetical protein FJQ89_06555 [Janthinobacterium tructae]
MPYGRDQMTAIASDLVAHGFAVWNMEYRRLGAPQAGWPATMDDVAAGIDYLADLCVGGVHVDLDRVIMIGHSAGAVPIEFSRGYARAAEAAGDTVEIIELPGTGHMEYLDPDSDAHAILRRWLLASMSEAGSQVSAVEQQLSADGVHAAAEQER